MDINSFVIGFQKGKASGGAELNIAYGDTPPEDITKLWVKTDKPNNVIVSKSTEKMVGEVGELDITKDTTTNSSMRYMSRTSSAVIGNKIYTAGGKGFIYQVYAFDVDTKKQTHVATLPTALQYTAVAAIGNLLYIIGGHRSGAMVNTIHVYDVEENKFNTLDKTLPVAACSLTVVAVGNVIYIFGGESFESNPQTVPTQVLRFDTETNDIVACEPLPFPRQTATPVVVSGNKIYLLGGSTKAGVGPTDVIMCFDVDTEKTEVLQETLPYPVFNAAYAVFGDNAFLFGGNPTTTSETTSNIVVFNATTKKSVVLRDKLPLSLYSAVCENVNGIFHFFGGSYASGGNNTGSYSIVPYRVALPNNDMQIIPSETTNLFPLINSSACKVEIGVNKVYKGNSDNRGDFPDVALYKDGEWSLI